MVTILSPEALPAIRMSVDEYFEADLPEGYQYELVDGTIVVSPHPDGEHNESVTSMVFALIGYQRDHAGALRHIDVEPSVPIPDRATIRGPDLAVYKRWEAKGRGHAVWKEFTPAIVVEAVSKGGGDRDYNEKRDEYWAAGIDEYWIIDRFKEQVTVLTRGQDDWAQVGYGMRDSAESRALPGLTIPVSDLIG